MASIDNLKHFVAVVESGGVNVAAKREFISASSLSRSVQQIEQKAGHALFIRAGRKIKLNAMGRLFYERTKALIESYEDLFTDEQTDSLLENEQLVL